jgi:pyruvate dehydrogenase E2 component (dihydrolipoamide acetyltransferase)
MAELINMPKLGFDMQEGTFAAWVKKVGDSIQSGDVIAEIETDKATVEVETYASGTLLHVLAEAGDILEVGAPIAIIGAEGEDYSGLLQGGAPAKQPQPEAVPAAAESTESAPSAPQQDGNGRLPGGVKASPVARRIAEDKGVDLKQVSGSGPGGRIIKRDVEEFTPGAAPAKAPAAMPAAGTAPSYQIMSDLKHEVIPTSRLRATIARRMVESKQNVPHFTVTMEMDTGELVALRKQINDKLDDDHKVTVNDMIVKAAAVALREFPNLNTHFHGDQFVRYQQINIGIAVALPNGGLLNVVARNADVTALSELARKNKVMVAGAREGKVRPEDIEGSTFTVSNLGAYGVEHFTAIINPPEAGILAVGASKAIPIVNDEGELSIGNRMKITISVDHRTSDGAEGAEYMRYLRELIEDPIRLLV